MSKQYLEFTDHADWPHGCIVIYVYEDGTASVTKGDQPYAHERFPFATAVEKAQTMQHNEVGLGDIIVHLSEGASSPQ